MLDFNDDSKKCTKGALHATIRNQGFGWCKFCGFLFKERHGADVRPPKLEIREKKIKLKDLMTIFKVAKFERRVNERHMHKIAQAILENRLPDNFIHCVEDKGQLVVIDAQHRITALQYCYEKYGLEEYLLYIIVYPTENARETYEALNLGKVLTAYDRTLALDDGRQPFFNELRPFLSHYRQVKHLAFADAMFCFKYAIGLSMDGDSANMGRILKKMTDQDVRTLKAFFNAMQKEAGPTIFKNWLYKSSIIRNMFRHGYVKDFEYDDFVAMIRHIKRDPNIFKSQKLHGEDLTRFLKSYFDNLEIKA